MIQGAKLMSSPGQASITSVLKETRVFPPSAEFAAEAHVKSLAEYERLWQWAHEEPDAFWAEQAKSLDWFQPFTQVLDWQEPDARWVLNGKLNASYHLP